MENVGYPFSAMQIDWPSVKRVLVVRLRSIGDTVLATPSLIALRRFLPNAKIDILLEDWVAPVLDGFDAVDEVLIAGTTTAMRIATARELRRRNYDVAFNMHGGTTATFLTFASGANHRVGYSSYRYSFLYDHRLKSSSDFWKREKTHSAEQQLALLGCVGIPVDDRPRSRLAVTPNSVRSMAAKLDRLNFDPNQNYAVIHPVAAFDSKRWPLENFAEAACFLNENGFRCIAIGSHDDERDLGGLRDLCDFPLLATGDLNLPETTALLSKAELFVGNDSGIAHMAAAVNTPSVVIYGSSNRDHWYPWTDARNQIVFEEFTCQPCAGYRCEVYDEPRCIQAVTTRDVIAAIGRVTAGHDGQ